MLIIDDSLKKKNCKKVFDFNISLFKKCYIHNIFTINFHNIVTWRYSNIPYSFNIFRLRLFWVKIISGNAFSEMRMFGWFRK